MQSTKPIIVVPMAGLGTRFSKAGYTDIKPLIPIFGKPMIEHVIDSVGIDGDWIFIVQKDHREKYNLDEVLTSLRPGCVIVDTGGGVTEGAACSLLLTSPYINNDRPLIVINSDNIILWNSKTIFDEFVKSDNDGLILTFTDDDKKWSFAKLDDRNQYVTRVAEKDPISTNATAGMYIWKRGRDFVAGAVNMILKNIRTNNEFYLCPVYNENIEMGQKIVIRPVIEMHGVGTPEDLERYIKR